MMYIEGVKLILIYVFYLFHVRVPCWLKRPPPFAFLFITPLASGDRGWQSLWHLPQRQSSTLELNKQALVRYYN